MVGLLLNSFLNALRVRRINWLDEAGKTAPKATAAAGTRAKKADGWERQVVVECCQDCCRLN